MTGGNSTEISVKGKPMTVPSARINGRTVIVTGKWLKMACVQDDEMTEGETITDPDVFVTDLKTAKLKADLVTFAQKLPENVPNYGFYLEWDNLAVVPITSYREWFEGRTDPVRRAIKKAQRLGVVARVVEFNDEFVGGIKGIYDETPVRQGKPFWHYQKDFDTIKRQSSTYPDRSTYIGVYYGDELIGFSWLVHVGKVAHMIQVISKMKYYEKRPSNALIAKVVEVCEQKGVTHLVYGNYVYNDPNSTLTEFKRRNGFEKVLLPRYYIPLTLKGGIALKLRLHRGIMGLLPQKVKGLLLNARAMFFERVAASSISMETK